MLTLTQRLRVPRGEVTPPVRDPVERGERNVGRRQQGFIVSAELIFIVTVLVIGLLAGWVMTRDNVLGELQDVANAIGSVNQSYTYNGTAEASDPPNQENTQTSGSFFVDGPDESDLQVILVSVPPVGSGFSGPINSIIKDDYPEPMLGLSEDGLPELND